MRAEGLPFEPVTIGPLTLRNRFIKSGANEAMCLDGRPTAALVKHHRDLARGGVGMTTVAYMAVAPEGRTLPNQIWIRPGILPDLLALTSVAVYGVMLAGWSSGSKYPLLGSVRASAQSSS